MPLTNTLINLSFSSEGVGNVVRITVAIPSNIANAVELLAANANRKGAIFWNNSTGNVFVDFSAVPTLSVFAAKLKPGDYWELPYGYTGQIQGIWDEAGGTGVLIREFS